MKGTNNTNENAIECRGWSLFTVAKSLIAFKARLRVLYGKKFSAIQQARVIFEFSKGWSDVLLTDRATQDDWERFFRDKQTQELMQGLTRCALGSPDHLRDIADTLVQLKTGGVKTANDRAVALELITAYTSCDDEYHACPPLSEIRRVFIDRYGAARWPGDVSARRTLLDLNIPLGKAKRGRPKGAKSKQKEYGLDRQPRKLKQ
jgi:hypothetical protein